jgi:hypothetical protein
VFAAPPAPPYAAPFAAPASYQQPAFASPAYPGTSAVDRFGMPANPFAAPPMLTPGPPPGGWPAKLGLVLPQNAVETGDLPHVCVVTGRPTDHFVKRRWVWATKWLLLLFFFGVFPVFLFQELVGDKVAGYLPVHTSVRRRYRRQAGGLFVGGVVLFVAGIAAKQGGLVALAVLMVLSALVPLVRYGSRIQLRRAAPGFVALPKAHPAFRSAFTQGRQPGEQAHASQPPRYNSGLRVAIYAALSALALGGGVVNGFATAGHCSRGRQHPNVAAVDSAFAESRTNVAQINGASNGLTEQSAAQLATEHQRLIGVLQGIRLSGSDRDAVDLYDASLAAYDQQIQTALQMSDLQSADSAVQNANAALDGASQQLSESLQSVPIDCTT